MEPAEEKLMKEVMKDEPAKLDKLTKEVMKEDELGGVGGGTR